jgi:hypothetical protein
LAALGLHDLDRAIPTDALVAQLEDLEVEGGYAYEQGHEKSDAAVAAVPVAILLVEPRVKLGGPTTTPTVVVFQRLRAERPDLGDRCDTGGPAREGWRQPQAPCAQRQMRLQAWGFSPIVLVSWACLIFAILCSRWGDGDRNGDWTARPRDGSIRVEYLPRGTYPVIGEHILVMLAHYDPIGP